MILSEISKCKFALFLSCAGLFGTWIASLVGAADQIHVTYIAGCVIAICALPGAVIAFFVRWRQRDNFVALCGVVLGLIGVLYLPSIWFPIIRRMNH